MNFKRFPSKPKLKNFKDEARDLLKSHKAGKRNTSKRIKQSHACMSECLESDIMHAKFTLDDAELVIAWEYGFSDWEDLKGAVVSSIRKQEKYKPYTHRDDAHKSIIMVAQGHPEIEIPDEIYDFIEAVVTNRNPLPVLPAQKVKALLVYGNVLVAIVIERDAHPELTSLLDNTELMCRYLMLDNLEARDALDNFRKIEVGFLEGEDEDEIKAGGRRLPRGDEWEKYLEVMNVNTGEIVKNTIHDDYYSPRTVALRSEVLNLIEDIRQHNQEKRSKSE